MKKYLSALAAMLLFMIPCTMNGKDIIFIKVEPPIQPHSPQPGSSAIICGEYDEEELTINFENYTGAVTITVYDNAIIPHVVLTDFASVTSPDSVNIGLTSLTSGTYHIMITLSNGDEYHATISI